MSHPVVVILVEHDRHVLIQERLRQGKRIHEFPCGRLESGETPVQAARRELREETGLDSNAAPLSPVFSLPGEQGVAVHYVRLALPVGSQPQMTDPRRQQVFTWHAWSDLPGQDWFEQLAPADRRYVHLRQDAERRPPFYASIATAYETIFPVDDDTAEFLIRNLSPGATVLDLACGTGGYSRNLARRGFRVMGLDFDDASIALAEAGPAIHPAPSFHAADMVMVDRLFPAASFQLIHCIGNSLVHLPDEASIAATLKAIRPLLSPGGELVLQIINYDRILDRGITALPTIERGGLRFVRHYDHQGTHVRFRTELHGLTPEPVHNDIPLLALRQGSLETMLRDAGLTTLHWTGELGDDQPWTKDSYATVVRARITP